jgi:DNA-binding transcriptional ArsR family regulator
VPLAVCSLHARDIATRIGIGGEHLVTRPLGKRYWPYFEKWMSECGTSRCILDFENVELVDSSFADEVLGTVAAERAQHVLAWPCVLLRNLNSVSRENLDMALLSRPIRQPGLRNCALPILLDSGEIELAGKAEEHVRQSFGALHQYGQLTARELADHDGLEISAASTRLKVLFNLGLACREETRDERGRLYVYHRLG